MAKNLVVVVLHALLLPLLRLQRLPLVDVLVLVRLLKGHRALLLLLLEDVLGARTCASIDDVCPVLSRVPRKLLPSAIGQTSNIFTIYTRTHLLTMRTQALQISPLRFSASLKQSVQSSSYLPLSVNREL